MYIFVQGKSQGNNELEFDFERIEIYADGKMSSAFIDETNPSLVLNIAQSLRMHAGSTIEVSKI